jgi:Holliday junction resolvase RusA-like endonuclease
MSSDYLKIFYKGKISDLDALKIEFPEPWDKWPSVANTHRAFGNRIVLDPKTRKELQSLYDILVISCMKQLGEIPQFKAKTRVIVELGISAANSRKDIENVIKGVVDWCLIRTRIIDDDHQVWPVPVPLFWFPTQGSNGGYLSIWKFSRTRVKIEHI